MSSWRKYSIYKRLIAVTIFSFAVQALLMVSVTATRFSSGLSQADATFAALMTKNEQHISEQFDSIKNIASSVGYASDVQEYFLSMTASERVDSYQSLKYLFSLLINSNPAAKALYLMNGDGVFLENGGYLYLFEQFRMDYGDTGTRIPQKSFFSKIYYDIEDRLKQHPYCIYFMPVNTLASVVPSGSSQMYCAVLFDIAQLLEMDVTDTSNMEILSYDMQILAANRQFSAAEAFLNHPDAQRSSITVHTGGKDYYMRSFELDVDAPVLYTFIAPLDTLMGDVTTYVRFSLMMIAVCFTATVCLLISMRSSIIRPIRQMTHDMMAVTDSSGIIRPTEAEELNVLSTGVNQMLHKLRDMQKQELVHQREYYQMSLEKTQAEMLGYRSQINPHFLFNTLECMCGMARCHGIKPLEDLTIAMADSFRYVLRAPDYASLEQEIAHVHNYMQIMDIRYPGRFHLCVQVSEEDAVRQVLSLILQPLVENAVLHGFVDYDKDEPCTICVSACTAEQYIHLQVLDNGSGMPPERLSQTRERMYSTTMHMERSHIALQNICRRLRFAYSERGRMEIHSEEGRFTRIDIWIPL